MLIVWAFIAQPPITALPPPEVHITIPPPQKPPRPIPPPLTLLVPRVATVAPPDVMIPSPQPPDPAAPVTALGPPASAVAPVPAAPKQPPPDYLARLAAYLNSYKNYPYGARRRREQGTARLHFVMDRAGHVLSLQLASSSGWSDLDDEALNLITRAQPLPPVPADYPGETLDLIVPIVFSLR